MKCILIGYPGSQKIIKASKYLTSKYIPGIDVHYINYTGNVKGWGGYVAACLMFLEDEYILFSLDDYLLSDYIEVDKYKAALSEMGGEIVCAKLCQSTPEEHAEYPVTTQYCIWNTRYLISLLQKINDPWEFEIIGSKLFIKTVIHRPCMHYFTNSSISSRWEGVNLSGLKESDVTYLKENNLL